MSIEHDPRISKIFYYFEEHTSIATGRTLGRKIGVIQEILLKKLLLTSQSIRDSLIYEPKIKGFSGATHKVEFVFFRPILCVDLAEGESTLIPRVTGARVTARNIDVESGTVRLSIETPGSRPIKKTVALDQTLKDSALSDQLFQQRALLKVAGFHPGVVRLSILDLAQPAATIESKRVGAQRFSNTDKLGSGIQTIEKAKQASLVAIDFDLEFNRRLLALHREVPRPFKSIVVLGNGVHWTDNDLAVLGTYVDYTYLAQDSAIIAYADYVRARALEEGQSFFEYFMAYFNGMTKTPPDSFVTNLTDVTPMAPRDAPDIISVVEDQLRF